MYRVSSVVVGMVASFIFVGATAWAATPKTIGLEGRLTTQAGGPVTDGTYGLTLSLYASKSSQQASWSEKVSLPVKAGRFSHSLGAVNPLTLTVIDAAKAGWIGVQVDGDPELPRVALASVAYALRAAVADQAKTADTAQKALDLACSGCVSVSELKFDGDVDLGGNSLKAKNATFTGAVAATSVTAVSFVGDGSKLTGVQIAGGACKQGEVVVGVKQDGSVQCVKGGGGSDLLGGKVTDTFTEAGVGSKMPVDIPDNTGASATAQSTFGKVGTANTLSVKVALNNTDLSAVQLKLLPPNDKKVGLTLCDPCGAKDAKVFNQTYTAQSTLKSGSLKDFIGKSLEGAWTLQVLDSSFCVPQAPGNLTLCDTTNKLDGKLTTFEVSGQVTSAQSVKLGGTLQYALYAAPPFPCTAAKAGHAFFDTKKAKLTYCDGKFWVTAGQACGDNIVDTGEECDDGNKIDGDACSNTCQAAAGLSQSKPGSSCADVLAKAPALKSGLYWVSAGGTTAQAYCDMSTEGGGWTMIATVSAADAQSWTHTSGNWKKDSTFGKLDPTSNADYKSPLFAKLKANDVLFRHNNTFLLHAKGCLGGKTMSARFAALGWTCGGSASLSASTSCANACPIVKVSPKSADVALTEGKSPSHLFLHAGEANGVQDSNKDRAFFSTSVRNNVDAPLGLGSFCSGSCGGNPGDADVGQRNDGVVKAPANNWYGVFVR